MAETGPISQIAEKLANEMFGEFLWTRSGPINQDWSCQEPEKHDAKKHPTDVVFVYDEPYALKRTYLQCDLKSYAKGSITKSSVRKALLSLATQVSCAEVSDEWQRLYTSGDADYDISGLLFVYNHDGEYDKDFKKIIAELKNEALEIPIRSRIYLLGPEDIYWLDNVRLEMRQMRGSETAERLPAREYCAFHYPQLARKANIQNADARAATLEMLTSPWITLRYRTPGDRFERYVVFVRREASGPEEYEYLIDYLRHYQCLTEPDCVTVKVLAESAESSVLWGKAVDRYIRNVVFGNNDSNLAKIVKSIRFRPMEQIISKFSSVNVGMEDV